MFNKRGLSAIVASVILIALAMAAVAIVWVVVNNLVRGNIESAESCFGIFDEVNLNPRFTCYNSSGNELLFSISMEDIDIDEALIGISGQGTSKSFTITNEETLIVNVVMYPSRSANVKLPGKNGGLTYIYDLTSAGFPTGRPDSVEIAPVIGNNQCGVSDSITQIESCATLL